MNNNKGYSLTELLLAIFVLSIVMLGIAGILRSTSQFYRNGVQEVRVQEEAQLAVNLVEEMLVDAKTKPAFSNDALGDGSGVCKLSFQDESGTDINVKYYPGSNADHPNQLTIDYDDSNPNDDQILADYVTGFAVDGIDSTPATGDNKISVSVSMDNRGYEYTATKEVYMRNLPENSTISINTVPSGGGGGGGTAWDYEIELNRYDTFNLTIWYDANPAVAVEEIGTNFEQYFSKTVTSDDIVVSVDDAYNVKYGITSPSDIGLKFTTFGGAEKRVRFYFRDVKVFVSPNADVFVYPYGNSMNGQGCSTVIEAQGIDINKCLNANGATVKAKMILNSEEHTFTLKGQTGQSSVDNGSDGKHEFNNSTNHKLLLNVISDTAANGLIIGAANGGDPAGYNGGQSGMMSVEITITPTTPGNSAYSNTLNYKFRISDNVL